MCIGDNGVGILQLFFEKKHISLGLNMVKRLSSQLDEIIPIDKKKKGLILC